jgi:hypothetical protein
MPAQFRSSLPDVFEDAQADLFYQRYAMLELLYPQLFNVRTSTKGHEDSFKISGLGPFATKPEGTPISYDQAAQGPRRRTVHTTFALGYRVTMEAQEDAQYDVIDMLPEDLGDAARDHQENLAWALFNDAFAGSTYTGLDGLALCSTAHTTLKFRGSTLSNSLSPGVALSVTSIESMLTNMQLTQSEEGRRTPIHPAILLIHPDNAHEAYRLLETDNEPHTTEFKKNAVKSSRTGVVPLAVPYLSGSDNHWLISRKNQHSVTWFARKEVTHDSGKDSQTKDSLFDAHYRASVVFRDWRGTVGSAP